MELVLALAKDVVGMGLTLMVVVAVSVKDKEIVLEELRGVGWPNLTSLVSKKDLDDFEVVNQNYFVQTCTTEVKNSNMIFKEGQTLWYQFLYCFSSLLQRLTIVTESKVVVT